MPASGTPVGYQIGSASYTRNFSVSSQDTDPVGIAFNTDGTKMFIVGQAGQDVNEYTLSTGLNNGRVFLELFWYLKMAEHLTMALIATNGE